METSGNLAHPSHPQGCHYQLVFSERVGPVPYQNSAFAISAFPGVEISPGLLVHVIQHPDAPGHLRDGHHQLVLR